MDNNQINISYNRFITVFLNIMYINYKINNNIGCIAQNSIVENEETQTSDKEETQTSDKEETQTRDKETTS